VVAGGLVVPGKHLRVGLAVAQGLHGLHRRLQVLARYQQID